MNLIPSSLSSSRKRKFGDTGLLRALPATPRQQCQRMSVNTKHQSQPVVWSHPFFLYHWTPQVRGITLFMPAPLPGNVFITQQSTDYIWKYYLDRPLQCITASFLFLTSRMKTT